ncbi:arf-GAP with Rho-GAP domain, ANK repeat and PH domain-containing protein 3 isoform X1 [Zootoca vivipara]|uniref:arf-GAP with Rho-GAP domain, ANK repeat and PH domain-containing protein 3 isoform X1 n=1 Tax=Zootoca vivipara TaxID=8524 RepID=UPI00293BFCB5|nr:arf-GAP with Rho-GAP domain, ANK repeat and PH domain-containing protein 3 isoform X1 [Zootoca vivipara]XP_034959305.2 arf-GAP with Rho-GAP domain, ANK repeat and PH domain-containing protein 3 isoform X1 [Zootoca vivipara]XP_034959306.2 arf-GAP with Rho-GAP domain, ANK repeat and PH domain-containing protein 3 isoform X1 [Zootoca vivipara]XP_034959307.2 arf-GAP with Rho-GAP domain, ANK repeat and PH domain-containing protein 3 isoform X1 [Zootoca vivipara]
MHHQCSVDSDIADWLTLIHLERYWDTFKKHGYGSVKDVLSLSKEDLQKLGITATGHRKRILNLVQQTRLLVRDRSGHMAGDARYSSGKCVNSLDGTKAAEKNEVGTKKDVLVETIPSLGVELDSEDHSQHPRLNKEPAPPVTKPVPKPRTLFPRVHQAAKPEKVPSAQTPAPVCNPTSCSEPPLRTFIILEGFDPGESTTDAERLEFSPKHQAGPGDKVQGVALPPQSRPREGHLEYALQCFAPESGMSVHELTSSATFKSQPEDTASPTESRPSAGQVQKEPLLLPSALTKSASPGEQKASVSDVTVLLPVKSMEAKETLRSQPSDLVKQNGTVTVENARSLGQLCLDHPPQGLDNRSGPVEESISPYCESMFGQWWPAQEQAAASLEWQEYEELPECAPNQGEERPVNTKIEEKSQSMQPVRIGQNETGGYSSVETLWAKGSPFRLSDHLYPDETSEDLTISPYASYTSLSERSVTVLNGWLDKLSPQGNYVFQRRFVRFDGKSLMYFNNEKEPYPKGLVPLSVIDVVRSTKDNKFQVVTKQRIFVFRAESEAQRNEWCSVLQQRVAEQQLLRPRLCLSGTTRLQKSGHLELKGYKSKLYVVLVLAEMWLYKSEQFFKMGIAICLIEMQGATIREAKGRTFELITPFKIFSFGAESEREKREWMEALQNSIAETLYDYEVAEKIWSNKANRICADCRTLSPDWASVNLCVVICKQCAGQHRSLGSSISKVQSLKLDTSIWSNEMVQLFIMLGNEQVNRFWAAHLPPSEALHPEASADQRREFITRKYRYGRYRMPHPQYSSQENILQALCVAVSGPGLLKKMLQFFATTKETEVGGCGFVSKAKPWDNNGQDQQGNVSVEELSSEGVYNEITQPVAHRGYLYKATVVTKLAATKKSREDFQRVWCSLEKFFLFYETDRSSEPVGKIEMADVISLGVNRTDGLVSPISSERFHFALELYLSSERMQQLGTDGPDSLQSWASALGKWFTPLSCHCLLGYEFQKVGRLCYKSMLNPNQWLQGFFILQKSHLFICPGEEGAAEDSINLRQLQELSVVPLADGPEKKEMLILVEMGRTFCLQGASRLDFSAWCAAIQASAGGQGNALRDQQLSRSGIPIIVNSCIAFITQYGLQHEGIYRKNGAKSRIKTLMEEFRRDARNVKLRISDNFIEDVTDVLKRFFRELEDPVFTTYLHPQWKEAAAISQKPQRLERYKELINRLPRLNGRTLAALIGHLYRVQKCADLNQMTTKNLALLFAPSLFQTDGTGEHEVKVMEELIDNYVPIFNIEEDQVLQMDLENSLITTWRDVQLSQAGDIILEVYLEQKNPDCCVTLKVSPVMRAEELSNQVLEMRNVAPSLDIWLTFEVLENGELERPLHPKEKVLEQALQWCKLPKPSSAYLLVKKVPIREGSCLFTGAKRESPKCGLLKCREELPKLLGNKFQERYFVIRDRKLLLLKEKRSAKPEREWMLDVAKVYMGIRKKLKPPSQWGFTLVLEKQQLYLACMGQSDLWDWTTSILKAQHDSIRPVILRRRSSSDLSKQKFGTMPLIPLRGDSTNPTMLSANQTLHRLHTRRTLSMFFPMKMHQDSLEEQQEAAESEPVYEEVGNFADMGFLELQQSLLPPVDRTKKPVPCSEQAVSSSLPPCPAPRASGINVAKGCCFERTLRLEEKDLLPDRLPGHSVAPSAGVERMTELHQGPPAPDWEQGLSKEAPASPPEPPMGEEPQADASRKKSFQADWSINDKLMQELSSAILRKNESQAPATVGKQNPRDGAQAQLEGSRDLRTEIP